MNSKGMSQTLALIVAASVLMMTALTVIMLTQGSLGSLGESSNNQACSNAVRSQCTAMGLGGSDTIPASNVKGACTNDQGDWAYVNTGVNDEDGDDNIESVDCPSS